MAAKPIKKLNVAQEILLRLQKRVKSLNEAHRLIRESIAYCWTDAYSWVETVIASGECKSKLDAQRRLAKALGKTPSSIASWYFCGQFMREHKLSPKKCVPAAIRQAQFHWGSLTKSEKLRVISLLRKADETSRKAVNRIVATSANVLHKQANLRLSRAVNSRTLNKTRVKMELKCAQVFVEEFFDKDVEIVVVDRETKQEILRVE